MSEFDQTSVMNDINRNIQRIESILKILRFLAMYLPKQNIALLKPLRWPWIKTHKVHTFSLISQEGYYLRAVINGASTVNMNP